MEYLPAQYYPTLWAYGNCYQNASICMSFYLSCNVVSIQRNKRIPYIGGLKDFLTIFGKRLLIIYIYIILLSNYKETTLKTRKSRNIRLIHLFYIIP